jgi:hypothetical protein
MGDRSGSTRFEARFESALQAYQKTTGVTLVEHPLAVQLHNYHSVDSIITFLRYEARPFRDLQGSDRMMKSIESIASILYTLSTTTSLGEAIGPVRQNTLMSCTTPLTVFFLAIPTCESNTRWPRYTTRCVCRFLVRV